MLSVRVSVLLLFITGIHLPTAKLQTPPWDVNSYDMHQTGTAQSRLLQAFEQALLSNPLNLYNLQKYFFNRLGSPSRVKITVTTTVGNINLPVKVDCDDELYQTELGFFYNNCTAPGDLRKDGYPEACYRTWYNSPCHDCWIRTSSPTFSDTFMWADANHKLGTISELLLSDNIINSLLAIDFIGIFQFYLVLPSTNNFPNKILALRLFSHYNGYSNTASDLELSLNITELDFMPCDQDVVDTMRLLLVWTRAYARADYESKTIERAESDRGVIISTWIQTDYNHYGDPASHWGNDIGTVGYYTAKFINIVIFSIYFILNFVTLMCAYFFLEKITHHFLKNSNDHMVSHLYWSLSFFVGLFNTVVFLWNILAVTILYLEAILTENNFLYHMLSVKLACILITLILELAIAWKASKSVRVPVNKIVLSVNMSICTWPCFICCVPCFVICLMKHCCSNRYGRILHTIVLCNILWVIHQLVSTGIAVVFLAINDPPVTLTVLTLAILLFICVILMISTMFRIIIFGQRSYCKTFFTVLLSLIFWIGIMSLLIVSTILYLAFLEYGLNYSSLGGLILSAIPPSIIFVLGFYFKKEFTNSVSENETRGSDPPQTQRIRDQPRRLSTQPQTTPNLSINANEATPLTQEITE